MIVKCGSVRLYFIEVYDKFTMESRFYLLSYTLVSFVCFDFCALPIGLGVHYNLHYKNN